MRMNVLTNSLRSRLQCMKSVRIWSFSGPYPARMRENTDQKNSEYGHFSRRDHTYLAVNLSETFLWTQRNILLSTKLKQKENTTFWIIINFAGFHTENQWTQIL